MRKFIFFLFIILIIPYSYTQENPTLVDIPYKVFVNGGTNDFKKILYQDDSIKIKIKKLYSNNELFGFDLLPPTHDFAAFWAHYKNQWFYVKFRDKGAPLLLFKGLKTHEDEREYIEIYDLSKKPGHPLLFSSVGKLLAYKYHPFTNGLILFVHQYPCCRSASHDIYTLRELNGELHSTFKFFVGRDRGDMVGPFFPDKVKFSSNYNILEEKTELRWSPAIVNKNAFLDWTDSNLIIHYNKGALYKILYDNGEWQFVLFLNGIAEEQSMMLNYTNFENRGVYGWIKK